MALNVNPGTPELWSQNAIVAGRSLRHHLDPIEGTLSIKTTLEGHATWHTREGRFEVSPDTCLVLNEGQSYGLEIDSAVPVQTFCVFFRPGTIESFGFFERLRITPAELRQPLARLKTLWREESTDGLEADEALLDLAAGLRSSETGQMERENLSHASPGTREEVFRQLNRARDFALAHLHSRVTLDDMALAACLSTFHFHRLHREAFGETPHDFVTRAKIQRAMRLLRSGQDVGEVSLSLGFESVPTFTRLFKSRLGVTPGAFKMLA
jgi:AraC family transcriptional regulator